jgi:hypothetical protein
LILSHRKYRSYHSLRRRPIGAARRRSRPGLEALEGRALLASRLFALPVTDTGSIVELNPNTGQEVNRFAAPVASASSGENGLAFDGQTLYYMPYDGTSRLWELNPDTGAVLKVAPINAGSGHFDGLGVVGGKVYLQDDVNHDLIVVDPSTEDVIGQLIRPKRARRPSHASVNPTKARIATGYWDSVSSNRRRIRSGTRSRVARRAARRLGCYRSPGRAASRPGRPATLVGGGWVSIPTKPDLSSSPARPSGVIIARQPPGRSNSSNVGKESRIASSQFLRWASRSGRARITSPPTLLARPPVASGPALLGGRRRSRSPLRPRGRAARPVLLPGD